jgi:hypothetical protein
MKLPMAFLLRRQNGQDALADAAPLLASIRKGNRIPHRINRGWPAPCVMYIAPAIQPVPINPIFTKTTEGDIQ